MIGYLHLSGAAGAIWKARFRVIGMLILFGVVACQTPLDTAEPRSPATNSTPTLEAIAATSTPSPTETRARPTPTKTPTSTPTQTPVPPSETSIVEPESKPILEVSDVVCDQGQEASADVRLDLVGNDSLAGYEMALALEPQHLARFVSVEFPKGYGRTSNLPDSSVDLSFLNTESAIQPEGVGTNLFIFRLQCLQPGDGVINLIVRALDDERGAAIETGVKVARITVSDSTPTIKPEPTPTPAPTQDADLTPQKMPSGQGLGIITFTSNRNGNREIYVMNPDGSDVARLTNHPSTDWRPIWYPDGTKILFESNRGGGYDLFSILPDGSDVRQLTLFGSALGLYPAWSPDGSKIAFMAGPNGNFQIYVINRDGLGLTRLTNNAYDDRWPRWSPDGARIGFNSKGVAPDYGYYTMDASGANVGPLAGDPWLRWIGVFSAIDGRLLFASDHLTGHPDSEVFILSADGTDIQRVTHNPAYDSSPRWSSDGTKIAFHSDREGNTDIYIVNVDGSGLINLTNNPAEDFHPSWGPVDG